MAKCVCGKDAGNKKYCCSKCEYREQNKRKITRKVEAAIAGVMEENALLKAENARLQQEVTRTQNLIQLTTRNEKGWF